MNKLLHTHFPQPSINSWLLILRICIAVFMLTHGIPKLEKLMAGGEIKFADPIGVGVVPSLILAVFAECICSVFLLFGLGTRIVAAFLIINMSVAAFIAHSGAAFQTREPALLYLLFYITFFVFGAGMYSLDGLIHKRMDKKD